LGTLIDTCIFVEAEHGRLDLRTYIDPRPDEDFFLSVITASELLHGVHRAKPAEIRMRRSAFVEALLERFPLLPIDTTTARTHARIWAELAEAGQRIGPHDLWLAATCVSHGLTMITSNLREFSRVPGLVVEAWSTKTGR
jgi:tRNA(fMet)-specific endonuclease VapC